MTVAKISKQPRAAGPLAKDFNLDDYALYNLVRTSATYNEVMAAALKRYQLDTAKWRILILLDHKAPQSVGELSRRSVTRMPTLTRILDRMENDGLIKRQHMSEDKRVVEIVMTADASETLNIVRSIGQKVFEAAFDGISEKEIDQLVSTLKKVRNNLDRSPYE